MGGHCYRIALCSVVVVCVWCALVGAFNKFGKLVRVGEVCRVVVYRCVCGHVVHFVLHVGGGNVNCK